MLNSDKAIVTKAENLMISLQEAQERVLDSIPILPPVEVDLLNALGLSLARPVYAGNNVPPFTNSAMDGYALNGSDLIGADEKTPVVLTVVGDLAAGYTCDIHINSGEALRIMTGAPLPPGTDTVVQVELTKTIEKQVFIYKELETGSNVRYSGEDIKKGDKVLFPGIELGPAELGVAASLGVSKLFCFPRPVVGIITTGDELIAVDEKLTPGKIRDSNSYALYGLVQKAGGIPLRLGVAGDTFEVLEQMILKNIDKVDCLMTTGGVSVGDYDMVKDVLESLGDVNFWRILMKPGKPQAFGMIGNKPLFGFPGNPVSTMVSFEQLGRPALRKMMGCKKLFRTVVDAILEAPIVRKPGRVEFIRVSLSWRNGSFYARSTGSQGSGILSSMVKGNALAVIEPEISSLAAGSLVNVQILDKEILN